jgi:SAM-dependent methyltransferase
VVIAGTKPRGLDQAGHTGVGIGRLPTATARGRSVRVDADPDRRWLAAQWPFIRAHLPTAPARVLELGCGPLGGFIPALRADGYAAVGVDPQAPDEAGYHRIGFEDYTPPAPVDVVVACTSLHHVADLDQILDHIHGMLTRDGVLIVVEWARERFDERTARWCFAHCTPIAVDGEAGWLQRHRDRWTESGLPWEEDLRSWADGEGLHTGERILAGLDARFHRRVCTVGPYFFADLVDTTVADEQAAIDSGTIQAGSIRYVGRPR